MNTRKVKIKKNFTRKSKKIDPYSIPVVIISWNQLTFVKNMVDKLKKYKNPIIIMDNNSSYKPIFGYFKEIKKELKDRIDIRLLKKNHGHGVYLKFKDSLPKAFIVTDPDIDLNKKMPENFAEVLYKLSNIHKVFKVGLALDISEPDKIFNCKDYEQGYSIIEWESHFWKHKIPNKDYKLYRAPVDTTFCLVNTRYLYKNSDYHTSPAIRIAGDFTARHLPWYKNVLEDMLPRDELYFDIKHNKSKFINGCLRKKIKKITGRNVRHDTVYNNLDKIT